MSEGIQSRARGGWIDSGAVASTVAISGKVWLRVFLATQCMMIALVLLWPHMLWPFLCDAVMASLTFFFAADHLRSAKPEVRLIWIMLLAAMALLSIGHLLQFWVLLEKEFSLPPTLAKLSAGGLTWYSAFICARVPFLFLFAQIEENDDRPYFRVIDGLQSVLIIGLITLVFSPGTLGAAPMRPGQTLILLSLVFPLLAFFGWMNWLGRAPGYGRQLVGALTLYLLAKSLANAVANALADPASLALGVGPLLQEARNAPAMALILETMPHLILVTAALHQFRPRPLVLSGSQREIIRLLNPVCFTIASLFLAFAVAGENAALGGALILLSVLLYVLRSAKWQSDFRRLKEKVAVAAQARENFLLDINHEIRSPLTSISINASLLNRATALSAHQAVMAKTIHKGAELVILTLNDILDMSRMEFGALRIPLQPFEVGPVIGEVVELLELQAEYRKVGIDWRAAPVPPLLGDAKRFRQVLTNILANAIRHAPAHSKVVVEAELVAWAEGSAGRITVTDAGKGISQSQQDLLFRRFSQVGGSSADGLGLAISSALVKAMGGTISFESEPGKTKFWVELRLA